MRKPLLKLPASPLFWIITTVVTVGLVALLTFLLFFRSQPDPKTAFYQALENQLDWQEPTVIYTYTQDNTDYKQIRRQHYNEADDKLGYEKTGQFDPIQVGHLSGVFQEEQRCAGGDSFSRFYGLKPAFEKRSAEAEKSYRDFFNDNSDTWVKNTASCNHDILKAEGTANYQNFKLFIGKLPADKRAEIITLWQDQNLFKTDFTKTKKERRDGSLLYTFNVESSTERLLAFLQQNFPDQTKRFIDERITISKQAEPLQLVDASTQRFSVTVDTKTNQLYEVRYQTNLDINIKDLPKPEEYTNALQKSPYGKQPLDVRVRFDYDQRFMAEAPKSTITLDELNQLRQAQLQKVRQQVRSDAAQAEN